YESQRTYPSADHLIDLCVRAGLRLEKLIDMDFSPNHLKQFELPGLGLTDEPDLGRSLDELQDAIENLLPTEEERELLKRFRKASAEQKQRVMGLVGTHGRDRYLASSSSAGHTGQPIDQTRKAPPVGER